MAVCVVEYSIRPNGGRIVGLLAARTDCHAAEVVIEEGDLEARALDAAGAAVDEEVLVLAGRRHQEDVLLVQVAVLELQLPLGHGQRARHLADDAHGLRGLELRCKLRLANGSRIGIRTVPVQSITRDYFQQ